ncbi:MAG: hypothetical protein WAT91_06310 [Saprospiraceae bacterium]
MTKQILKVVAFGILGGLALFAFPFFLLKAVIVILLVGFMFRLFGGRRRFDHRFGPDFAFEGSGHMRQRFQQMSEEEKKAFFEKMKHHGCGFSERNKEPDVTTDNK